MQASKREGSEFSICCPLNISSTKVLDLMTNLQNVKAKSFQKRPNIFILLAGKFELLRPHFPQQPCWINVFSFLYVNKKHWLAQYFCLGQDRFSQIMKNKNIWSEFCWKMCLLQIIKLKDH